MHEYVFSRSATTRSSYGSSIAGRFHFEKQDGGLDLTLGNDDPSGKLIRQILGAVAEWEKCALVQKLRASRLRMRRAGQRCEGKKPYGHTPEEANVVDSILSLRQQGKSYVAIADQLNSEGVKPRSGQKWHPTQVQRAKAK